MEGRIIEDGREECKTRKLDIFSIHSRLSENITGNDGNGVVIERTDESLTRPARKKRRKKKRRLVDLKKSSSTVGVLPPLRTKLTSNEPAPQPKPTPDSKKDEDVESNEQKTISPRTQNPEANSNPPLKLCSLITKYPISAFLIASLPHVTTIIVTLALVGTGHDVFPLVFDELPLLLFNDARLRDLAWRSRTSYEDPVVRPVYGVQYPYWTRGKVKDTVEVIFEELEGGNLLQDRHLRMMQNAENMLYENSQYQDTYCTLDYYDVCIKPKSLLRLFDGTYSHVDSVFVDANFTNVPEVIYKASIYNETKEFLYLFLGKDAYITPTACHTAITRSVFLMGWPLGRVPDRSRYRNLEDLENFLLYEFKPSIEYIRDNVLVDVFHIYYLSKILFEADLINQALTDLHLAIGSILFIFLFMCFQMGSFTLSLLGMFSILSSFLLTNLIYRFILQYMYFGFFHVIIIFLILGIGADDLFVFYDTWRLSSHDSYPTDAHRLSECYRRAAKTTFVTSVTTMMAFLVSGLSPLLPVSTFGIFSGMLVAINYLFVILYFPTVMILHHTKIKDNWRTVHTFLLNVCMARDVLISNSIKTVPVRGRRGRGDTGTMLNNSSEDLIIPDDCSSSSNISSTSNTHDAKSHVEISMPEDTSLDSAHAPGVEGDMSQIGGNFSSISLSDDRKKKMSRDDKTRMCQCQSNSETGASPEPCQCEEVKVKKKFEERNRVVRFLTNGFYDFITKRPVKIIVPFLFLCVAVFFVVSATKMEPDTHQIRLFRDGHNYAKATEKHYFSFLRNDADEYTRLYIVWGMQPADISDCNMKSAEYCPGIPSWDPDIPFTSAHIQQAFKDICEQLEAIDSQTADALRIRRDTLTGKLQIACFVKPMEKFFQDTLQRRPAAKNISLTIPVTPGNVTDFMDHYAYIYQDSLGPNFDRFFEILVSFWLSNAYTYRATPDYYLFNDLLAEQREDGVTQAAFYYYSQRYYGTRLRYIAIEVNTTMNVYSLGYTEGLPVYNRWEEFMRGLLEPLPSQLQGGFQVTRDLWHWLHVQETLATSAITGILVGLLTAWPILILTTFNYVIGTLAVIVISLVTCCVVGFIPLVGWKLGVLESINLCMVVGLSVDYVVHLAEAYRMSTSPRRMDRVKEMLESIGLSVLSGATTTMGAAIFMLFAQIQFFFQFGIFILSTVGFSLLFALLGFTTFMALCGPQGNTGSLKGLYTKLVNKLLGDKNSQSDSKDGCKCVHPSALLDRFFDWLSYGKDGNIASPSYRR